MLFGGVEVLNCVVMMVQVTKLCDLGPNDSVCSLQWTREGSYISVGTSHGQVQVCCFFQPFNLWLWKVFDWMH